MWQFAVWLPFEDHLSTSDRLEKQDPAKADRELFGNDAHMDWCYSRELDNFPRIASAYCQIGDYKRPISPINKRYSGSEKDSIPAGSRDYI